MQKFATEIKDKKVAKKGKKLPKKQQKFCSKSAIL